MKKLILPALVALTAMVGAASAATITIHNHSQVWIYGSVERHDAGKTGIHESLDILPNSSQTFTNVYKVNSKLGWAGAPGWQFDDGMKTDRHIDVHYWQLSPGIYANPYDHAHLRSAE